MDNCRVENAYFSSVEFRQIAQGNRHEFEDILLRYTFLASLATVSLGGTALLVPGVVYAAPAPDAVEELSAVMGPAEDYQRGLTINGVSPTLRSVVVDGESILAYCIEYWIQAADPDHQSAVTGWNDFTGDNNFKTDPQVRERVAWILRNSHPTLSLTQLANNTGVTDLTEAEAIAATQAAIWHFTDDFVPDGKLRVESAEHSSQSVSIQSARNVQAVFDYFTGPANTGLSEHEVQASVTLVDATDAEVMPPESMDELIEDEGGQILGPIEVNASAEQIDLELTPTKAEVEISALTMLDTAGVELDISQPVDAQELWVHVPAETETGGVHIAAESSDFGYTGRLIIPEPDDQRRFQTIVMVDETTHQAATELELNWQKPQVEPPPEPETPPTPPEPPVEQPPVEEPPVEEEPPADEQLVEPTPVADVTPTATPQPEPEISEVEAPTKQLQNETAEKTQEHTAQRVEAAGELAETGPHQTRNILVAVATLAVGAGLLVLNRFMRKKA